MELEFKKYKKRDINPTKTGYYFKGEFLSRYLTKSLDILRSRILTLNYAEKEKTDEWKVLNFYFKRQTEITERIERKKKKYYGGLTEKGREGKILRLNQKIEGLNKRKIDTINFFEDKIIDIKIEIEQLK